MEKILYLIFRFSNNLPSLILFEDNSYGVSWEFQNQKLEWNISYKIFSSQTNESKSLNETLFKTLSISFVK